MTLRSSVRLGVCASVFVLAACPRPAPQPAPQPAPVDSTALRARADSLAALARRDSLSRAVRADSLAQATEWQNATDFGLTAGLHSLDPAEVAWWKERVLAGNLYINRPITGAIVQRQPFGGWKKSRIAQAVEAQYIVWPARFRAWADAGLLPATVDIHFQVSRRESRA